MAAAPGGGPPPAPGSNSLANKKEAAKALLKTGWLKTRSVLTNKSKIELLVEDATNLEPWGPTGPQMHEVAEACFDAEKFRQAWNVLLRRFESEPEHWRRIYKALLLTEHLLKNSSQHVVQTIIDAIGVLEGLKQFKFMDEKNKDQGINVSNRAKELVALLQNPDRIRAERAKAKSLKDKFRGASREDMAAGAGWGTAPSSGWAGAGASSWGPSSSGGASPGLSNQSSLAHGDDGHLGEQGQALGGEARPGKGYGALPTTAASDAVAATAQRIQGLRQAGLLGEEQSSSDGRAASSGGGSRPLARPSSEACLAAADGSSGGGMASSRSCDNLAAAAADGSHPTAKPSLHELMARRGPKKLGEVRVNPAIASTMAALGGTIKPPAAASPSKPALPVALPPPPASAAPARALAAAGSGGAAALADLLGGPAQAPALAAASPAGSPQWASATPAQASAFDAFGAAAPAGHHSAPSVPAMPAHPVAPASPSAKLGGSSPGVISLTASAGSGSPPPLPAYMFAEPTPPGYGAAASWGSHVAGTTAPQAHAQGQAKATSPKAAAAAGQDLFADFSPFR
ncbi:hypothetical protein ABPG75_006577 [Micractinium tetrahymenae]